MLIANPVKEGYLSGNGKVDFERIQTSSKSWRTSFEIAAIQPKRVINSNIIAYLGSTQTSEITVNSLLYGDCFPEPHKETLKIQFEAESFMLNCAGVIKIIEENPKPT